MDNHLINLVREALKPSGFIFFDSVELEGKLYGILKKIKEANDAKTLKKLVSDFAKSSWQGKKLEITLPDLEKYEAPITGKYSGHTRETVNKNAYPLEKAREISAKVAVSIAKLDDIISKGQKRGWTPGDHPDDPKRKDETWIYAMDTLYYPTVGRFECIVGIQNKNDGFSPITIYSTNVQGGSSWVNRRVSFMLSAKYEDGNILMEGKIS